uniref:Uncharacterized protein n=1 Tax=Triticum urartu TaxID=4572 RepID=A0A8R7V4Y3_TRIUA
MTTSSTTMSSSTEEYDVTLVIGNQEGTVMGTLSSLVITFFKLSSPQNDS